MTTVAKQNPFEKLIEAVTGVSLGCTRCGRKGKGPIRTRLESVQTASDAVWILQSIAAECSTTDDICKLVVGAYRKEPPSEREMQKLSVLYQGTEGGADIEAFATLTLWLCAIESFCSPFAPAPTMPIHRSHSIGMPLTAVVRRRISRTHQPHPISHVAFISASRPLRYLSDSPFAVVDDESERTERALAPVYPRASATAQRPHVREGERNFR